MRLLKRFTIILTALLLIAGVAAAILYQKGYFEDPQVALRELEQRGISPSAESVRTAAAKGDASTLDLLERAGADFAEANSEGETPLILALGGMHITTLPVISRAGWDLDARDAMGNTPLSLALDHGLHNVAKEFVAEGASPNFTLPDGELALPGYFRQKKADEVRLLLDAGANPDSPARDGQTILALALQGNQPTLACKLLENGADPNSKVLGEPVANALLENHRTWDLSESDAMRVLGTLILSGADLERPTSDGLRPIQIALSQNLTPALEQILPRAADLSGCLWLALKAKNSDSLTSLFANEVSPEEVGPEGDTPLLYAIRSNDSALVATLLDAGANPNQISKEGQPALFVALASKSSDAALAMLKHENAPDLSRPMADPVSEEFRDIFDRKGLFDWYCRNETGLTPIMAATMMRDLSVVERLIELGVDKFQGTTKGVYPIQMAAANGDVKMQQLLIGVSYHEEDQTRNFVIDLSEQKVRYYRDGELVKTSRVSTGRSGFRTAKGEYVITDKTRHKRSNIYDDAEMPYFQRFSCKAIGFHEGNTYSRFASHGCIRLPRDTARYFWKQTSIGDRVTIQD